MMLSFHKLLYNNKPAWPPLASLSKYYSRGAGVARAKGDPPSSARQPPRVYLLSMYKEPPVSLQEGLRALKAYSFCRQETVNIELKCKVKEQIRGYVKFPHQFGGKLKVLVFAEGSAADAATEAGASIVGGSELVKKIATDGEVPKCDLVLATPSMMKELKTLGKIFKSKMPIERKGTVTDDIPNAMAHFENIREYRSRDERIFMPLGKISFTEQRIQENLDTLLEAVLSHRGQTNKDAFIERMILYKTFGPGFHLTKTF